MVGDDDSSFSECVCRLHSRLDGNIDIWTWRMVFGPVAHRFSNVQCRETSSYSLQYLLSFLNFVVNSLHSLIKYLCSYNWRISVRDIYGKQLDAFICNANQVKSSSICASITESEWSRARKLDKWN